MTPDDLDFFADKSGPVHNNRCMNSPTTGLRVASVIFGIFAIGHLLRLINHAQVMSERHTISNGPKLGRADRCRHSLYLDVATLEPERDRVVTF